ncbi:Deoxyribonuclease (DNase) II [Trichuris trichiura]|uniref:Deoxyribonuclease (DNase) II n=1 Tax=Trichuris trichiura TaxID=36087 RepID=A0A077ZM88_TRITR|nr:Deoxyribonuclease (DNase) II [Trichuris trichiura]
MRAENFTVRYVLFKPAGSLRLTGFGLEGNFESVIPKNKHAEGTDTEDKSNEEEKPKENNSGEESDEEKNSKKENSGEKSDEENVKKEDSGEKSDEEKNSKEEDSGEKTDEEKNSKEEDSGEKTDEEKNSKEEDSGEKGDEKKNNNKEEDSGEKNVEEKNLKKKGTGEKSDEEKNDKEDDSGEKSDEEKNSKEEDSGEKTDDEKNSKEEDSGEKSGEEKNSRKEDSGEKSGEKKNSKEEDSGGEKSKPKDTKPKGAKGRVIKISVASICDKDRSPLYATLKKVLDVLPKESLECRQQKQNAGGISYVIFNDQLPTSPGFATHGSSKGVVAFNGKRGFFLTHSAPGFPKIGKKYEWPDHLTRQAHLFVCLDVNEKDLQSIADRLVYSSPLIYASSFGTDPLKRLRNGVTTWIPRPVFSVQSRPNKPPTAFIFKHQSFNTDLASEVASTLSRPLIVFSGTSATRYNRLDIVCTKDRSIEHVSSATINGTYWMPHAGGASWAVSKQKDMFCLLSQGRTLTGMEIGLSNYVLIILTYPFPTEKDDLPTCECFHVTQRLFFRSLKDDLPNKDESNA